MNPRFATNRRRELYELLLMLLLLFVFAASAFVVVIIGTSTYQQIAENMSSHADHRIPLSYVGNKIRQNDQFGSVSLRKENETDVLVLEEKRDDISYETWIYPYEGSLYEVSFPSETPPELGDGTAVFSIYDFEMEIKNAKMLQLTSYDASGQGLSLSLALRSTAKEDAQ